MTSHPYCIYCMLLWCIYAYNGDDEFIVNGVTNSFWQSKTLWQWQWAHTPSIYYTILLLQMITNAINCMVAILTDTFSSIVCILFSGHLLVLERALQCLRVNEPYTSPSNDVKELIKCIKYHDLRVQLSINFQNNTK